MTRDRCQIDRDQGHWPLDRGNVPHIQSGRPDVLPVHDLASAVAFSGIPQAQNADARTTGKTQLPLGTHRTMPPATSGVRPIPPKTRIVIATGPAFGSLCKERPHACRPFREMRNMVGIGSGAQRELEDGPLRYACYVSLRWPAGRPKFALKSPGTAKTYAKHPIYGRVLILNRQGGGNG